jgi:alpha-glucosidase (family GH31 glycosyl hydrolase)
MDHEADFTVDPINFPGLPAYVDEKRAQGMRYVPIVDPAIASRPGYETYNRGLNSNSYIQQENGEVLMGNVRKTCVKQYTFPSMNIYNLHILLCAGLATRTSQFSRFL